LKTRVNSVSGDLCVNKAGAAYAGENQSGIEEEGNQDARMIEFGMKRFSGVCCGLMGQPSQLDNFRGGCAPSCTSPFLRPRNFLGRSEMVPPPGIDGETKKREILLKGAVVAEWP
jgi:hypothetical protein